MLTFFKKIRTYYVKTVQKVLITFALTLIYFIGLGCTWIFAVFFKRGLLYPRPSSPNSTWEEALEYTGTLDNCQEHN